MHEIVHKYLKNLKRTDDGYYIGYIDTSNTYDQFHIDLYAAGFSFCVRDSETCRTGGKFLFKSNSSSSSLPVLFCGSPFQCVKNTRFECSHGIKYFGNKHATTTKELGEHPKTKKKRLNIQPSKKIGCSAKMRTKCIKVYPDYKVVSDDHSHWRFKKEIIDKLKEDLKSSNPPRSILRYHVHISEAAHHCHSAASTMLGERLHSKLTDEIRRLVKQNITSTKTIKVHLREFVENMFKDKEKPDESNAGFYPSDKIIKNYTYAALFEIKQSKIDQEALEQMICKWKQTAPEDSFYFQPFKPRDEENDVQPLLFCYQSDWQKKLLQRYGNNICLLDTTYKTMNYCLPLFSIVVKTNVGYSVVGSFIIQVENSSSIKEALNVFSDWNSSWKPQYFLTEYSDLLINAIESVFECTVYICAFHREQAWNRWLNKSGNINGEFVEEMKSFWCGIAHSKDRKSYQKNLEKMENSNAWKHSVAAQRFINTQWLPVAARWVDAFCTFDYLANIRINNGIESQSSLLKHTYLSNYSDKSLTGMLTVLLEDCLPAMFQTYVTSNGQLSLDFKKYHKHVQNYLQKHFIKVKHFIRRLNIAKIEYDITKINYFCDGLFAVQSQEDSKIWYAVDFNVPSCMCADFIKWGYPCKHFCAIFLNVPEWTYEKLPASYQKNPYLNVDNQFVKNFDDIMSSGDDISLNNEMEEGNQSYLESHCIQSFDESASSDGYISLSNETEHGNQSPLVLITSDREESPAQRDKPALVAKSEGCGPLGESQSISDLANADVISIFRTTIGEQLVQQCHEKIQEILNLTYLCNDKVELQTLLLKLTKLTKGLEEKICKSSEQTCLASHTPQPFFKKKRKIDGVKELSSFTNKKVKHDQEKNIDTSKYVDLPITSQSTIWTILQVP